MPTSALDTSKVNLRRATYFLDIHRDASTGPGAPNKKLRELPRSAVVFAVGALGAYLSEVAAEVMVSQFGNGTTTQESRKMLASIQKELPTLAIELAMAEPGLDRAEHIRKQIVEHFYDKVSNHGASAVATTVIRMGAKPGPVWSTVEKAGHADPQARLESMTRRRHAIVHRGKAVRTTRQLAHRCVLLAGAICDSVDEIAVDAMKTAASP